jgi:hypothetical protein
MPIEPCINICIISKNKLKKETLSTVRQEAASSLCLPFVNISTSHAFFSTPQHAPLLTTSLAALSVRRRGHFISSMTFPEDAIDELTFFPFNDDVHFATFITSIN